MWAICHYSYGAPFVHGAAYILDTSLAHHNVSWYWVCLDSTIGLSQITPPI